MFDPKETLIGATLGKHAQLSYLMFVRRYAVKLAIALLSIVGYSLASVNIVANGYLSLSIMALLFCLPSILHVILTLNPFLLRRVLKSFEFWFLTMTNVLLVVMAACYLLKRDVTALGVFVACTGVEEALLIDSYHYTVRKNSRHQLFGSILCLSILPLCTAFGFIHDMNRFSFTVFSKDYFVSDVCINAAGTILVFYVKNYLRVVKDVQAVRPVSGLDSYTMPVKTLSLRRPLQLLHLDEEEYLQDRARLPAHSFDYVYLRAKVPMPRYSGLPRWLFRSDNRFYALMALLSCVSCILFLMATSPPITASLGGDTAMVALSASGIVVSIYCSLMIWLRCNQTLLNLTFQSFDVLFASSQCFFSVIIFFDMFSWDLRCLNLIPFVILFHTGYLLDGDVSFGANIRIKRIYGTILWCLIFLCELQMINMLHEVTFPFSNMRDRVILQVSAPSGEGEAVTDISPEATSSSSSSGSDIYHQHKLGIHTSNLAVYRVISMAVFTLKTLLRVMRHPRQLTFIYSRFQYEVTIVRR